MQTKQFQAESKRLLDLMINSIYTHREIFLRELISNASDAIDKLYYHSLSDGTTGLSRADFAINLVVDKDARTLKITDNGCGMTAEELESNLGTIAKSGSLAFKQENEKNDEIDVIGQFGVGFYSAFMVASCVTVVSKPFGSEQAFRWQSYGADGYTIEECEKEGHGTEITLVIKENEGEESYDEFLEPHRISGIVKKYSDYIRYPIRMDMPATRVKEGSPEDKPEYEQYTVNETLNSMVPIWKKSKSEVTDEDYNNFYKDKFFDYQDPVRVIHSSTEGAATYNALLFIPARAPYNYYSREYEKGLQLYASGKGYKAIVGRINREGYRTKLDNAFSVAQIKSILTNPVYIGKVRYDVRRDWNEKRRNNINPNPIVADGKHEAIIPEELWEQVQFMISQKNGKPTRIYDREYPLTGILKCPQCGAVGL